MEGVWREWDGAPMAGIALSAVVLVAVGMMVVLVVCT